MLENRLDKAMIKFNEAQSIRKTYEQIVKRLTEERVGFDNQLSAIERTLAAKQHDYEELQLLSGDAAHAREMALQAAQKMHQKYKEDYEVRQKDLQERQLLLQQKEAVARYRDFIKVPFFYFSCSLQRLHLSPYHCHLHIHVFLYTVAWRREKRRG